MCSLPGKGKGLVVGWNRDWGGKGAGWCSRPWDLCQHEETAGESLQTDLWVQTGEK